MPIGSRHSESGVLMQSANGLVLRRDAGGRWQLDAPRKAKNLVGKRVTVKATRVGFDLLDVEEIYLEGTQPRQPFIASWQFRAGALTGLALLAAAIIVATQLSGQP